MRTPERQQAKVVLQAWVSAKSHERAYAVFERLRPRFRSFSQLTEAMLFLAKSACYEQGGDGFARRLVRVKAVDLLETEDLSAQVERHKVSVSVDRAADEFLAELVRRYPAVSAGKGEMLELIYLYAATISSRHEAYFARRLEEALRLEV